MKLKSEVEEVVFVFSFHTITTTTENIIITNASLLQELKLSTLSIKENNKKKKKKVKKNEAIQVADIMESLTMLYDGVKKLLPFIHSQKFIFSIKIVAVSVC